MNEQKRGQDFGIANGNPNSENSIGIFRADSGERITHSFTGKNTSNPLDRSKKMGMTSEEFWKGSSHDIPDLEAKFKKTSNKIVPLVHKTGELTNSIERIATANDGNKYNKERERDPASIMAALHYKRIHSLRNENNDMNFSVWWSSVDTILDNSNSHPSFRIYFAFIRRFLMTMFIIFLLQLCLAVYMYSCDWYPKKDLKFGFERSFLGNIDGVSYISQGKFATNIGKDNSEVGRDVVIGVDIVSLIFFWTFLIYQIYTSRVELRAKYSPISIRDYAVKVTNISSKCPAGVEREIQKNFIRFGTIAEIVPINNYTKALEYELEIRRVGQKIGDRKAKDQIRNKNNQKKIDELIKQEMKLIEKQKVYYSKLKKELHPREVVVVFETVQNRNDWLNEYAKYSHWYSCKKVPNDQKLFGMHSYKVKEAPEPFDYKIENWHSWRWIPWLIYGISIVVLIASVMVSYKYLIKELNDNYNKIEIYTECDKYYFEAVTTANYSSTTTASRKEISWFCREQGYDKVEDNCSGTTNEGCKSVCQYWLDYFGDYYSQYFFVMLIMLAVNVVVTYGFKILFNPAFFKFRYNSTRYILTAINVCFFIILFLGILPEFYFDSSNWDLDRVWYLKAATVYYGYFLWSLFLYPIETFTYWFVTFLHRKFVRPTKVIQKDLNKLFVGQKLDYSHKIGRLMGHAFICVYHGVSIPMLYLYFVIMISMFFAIEKFMMLKFYRKMELQTAWIRQFLIHVLYLAIIFHSFRAIDVLGSEDLFPENFKQSVAIKNGTLVNYYKANKRDYLNRMFSISGYPYLFIAILTFIVYIVSWWSHKKLISSIFGWISLKSKPGKNHIQLSTVKDRDYSFKPTTYDFTKMPNYGEAVIDVKNVFEDGKQDRKRDHSFVESNYDLKSEANSNDDALPRSQINSPMTNIYGKDSVILGANLNKSADDEIKRGDSEELDDIELH